MFPILRKLNAEHLLDWRTQIAPFTWLIAVHIADQPLSSEDALPRLLILVSSYAALYFTLMLFWFFWLRFLQPSKTFLPVAIAILSAGFIRGFVFTQLLSEIGFASSADY